MIDYVKKLREKADLLEKRGFATCGLAQDYRECARIIEKLSEQPQPYKKEGAYDANADET